MGFYDYLYAQNNRPTTSTAMDEQPKEEMVTIRQIFKIDPKMQKELGREQKDDEDKQEVQQQPTVEAKDQAVAEDALSKRHSSTPLEDCKAKDPRYCPYHGAMKMTADLDAAFKGAGIYAIGSVERLGQGKFKVQYSVPKSKKDAANGIINKFLSAPGFELVEEADSDDVDAIAKNVKMDRGNDNFAMREEHLERLEDDMKKGAKVDPSELYQLRKDHSDLKKLWDDAFKASEAAGMEGISHRTKEFKEWAATNEAWQKAVEAQGKFDKDYNFVRGNADLAHIEKPEDIIEMMDHLNGQIDKVGTFMRAEADVKALKEKLGIKRMPPGLLETDKYNKAMSETRHLAAELEAARQSCEDAKESGDIRKQRAAAHELEIVLRNLEENKDVVNKAYEAAKEFEAFLKDKDLDKLSALAKEARDKKKAADAEAAKKAAEEAGASGSSEGKEEKAASAPEKPESESKEDDEDKPESVAEKYDLDFSEGGEVDQVAEIMSDDLGELASVEGIKDALKERDASGFNFLALQLSDEAIKKILSEMGEDNAFVEAIKDGRKGVLVRGGKEESKAGDKPVKAKSDYSDKELEDLFGGVQDELKKLYKEAGYERAMELQKKIEDDTGKSIFDIPELENSSANCFHSGTWQIWNGDGVSDMTDIFKEFDDAKTPEELIDTYKGLDKHIKEFVKKAEDYSKEHGRSDTDEPMPKESDGGTTSKSDAGTSKSDAPKSDAEKDAKGKLTKALGDIDDVEPKLEKETDDDYCYSLKEGDKGKVVAMVNKKSGHVSFGYGPKDGKGTFFTTDPSHPFAQFDLDHKKGPSSSGKAESTTSEKADEDGMTESSYKDMVDKFFKHHKLSPSVSKDPGEFKSLLRAAKEGRFDLTPAGGGKYSNDMQFLDDIRAAVGKDHPFIKTIEGYIEKMKSGKSGSTESSSTSEKKPTDADDRTSAKEAWKKAAKAKDDFWDRMMSKATEKTTKGAIAAMTPEDRAERDRVEKAEAEAYSAYKGSGKHDSGKSDASKYLDTVKAEKAAHYKDKFIKKFGDDKYGQVAAAADKAKSEKRSLNGISKPGSGIDPKSLTSLVKKMGGTAKVMESGTVQFSIAPEKAHELYAKMDARGGEVNYDAD